MSLGHSLTALSHYLVTDTISLIVEYWWKIPVYCIVKMNILKSHIQRMSEVNVSVWAWVSHANFSRSLAVLCASWVVPVAIVGNRLMWKLKPHATRWTTMERRKAHTSRFKAKASLDTQFKHTALEHMWSYFHRRHALYVSKDIFTICFLIMDVIIFVFEWEMVYTVKYTIALLCMSHSCSAGQTHKKHELLSLITILYPITQLTTLTET